jgi:hypothetical protein
MQSGAEAGTLGSNPVSVTCGMTITVTDAIAFETLTLDSTDPIIKTICSGDGLTIKNAGRGSMDRGLTLDCQDMRLLRRRIRSIVDERTRDRQCRTRHHLQGKKRRQQLRRLDRSRLCGRHLPSSRVRHATWRDRLVRQWDNLSEGKPAVRTRGVPDHDGRSVLAERAGQMLARA